MTDGKIPTAPHNVPVSHHQPGAGIIQISESSRPTEEAIHVSCRKQEATDTVAEMEAKGLFRCSYDGAWLDRSEFSPDARKRNGLKSICKKHAAASERQREARQYLQAQERYHYRTRKP